MRGRAEFRVASYNVHGCVGADGHYDPHRILAVIQELDADIIGLQEVVAGPTPRTQHGVDLLDLAAGPYTVQHGPVRRMNGQDCGNALLIRGSIDAARIHDISVPNREARGLLTADVSIGETEARILVTHLGLRAAERQRQALELADIARSGPSRPTLLLGDFNEWRPWARTLSPIAALFENSVALPSFPTGFNLLPLDRIWSNTSGSLHQGSIHRSRNARTASDHYPVTAKWRPVRPLA